MSRSDDLRDPVVIVGGNHRMEMELLRTLGAITGMGAWLAGPSGHYAHTPRLPRRQQRKPALVFEDRTQMVQMYRDRGIVCCQVAPGDF